MAPSQHAVSAPTVCEQIPLKDITTYDGEQVKQGMLLFNRFAVLGGHRLIEYRVVSDIGLRFTTKNQGTLLGIVVVGDKPFAISMDPQDFVASTAKSKADEVTCRVDTIKAKITRKPRPGQEQQGPI